MTTSIVTEIRSDTASVGDRFQLARCAVIAGDRLLYGQRVDGVVRITNVPARGQGRAYVVERGLEEEGANANAAPHAHIGDYLRQPAILDRAPMAIARVD